MPRGEGFEIVPPQENFAEGRIDAEGRNGNLVIADKNPNNKSAWITDKSDNRTSDIYYGNDGIQAAKEEFNKRERGEQENKG